MGGNMYYLNLKANFWFLQKSTSEITNVTIKCLLFRKEVFKMLIAMCGVEV